MLKFKMTLKLLIFSLYQKILLANMIKKDDIDLMNIEDKNIFLKKCFYKDQPKTLQNVQIFLELKYFLIKSILIIMKKKT